MKQVSVNNLAECTAQEVFDFVANHLLTQNEKSGEGYGCLYRCIRSGKQLSCAAGCLIPDAYYTENMEDKDWLALTATHKSWRTHKDLVMQLQEIHDDHLACDWPRELKAMAIALNLSTKILEQFE